MGWRESTGARNYSTWYFEVAASHQNDVRAAHKLRGYARSRQVPLGLLPRQHRPQNGRFGYVPGTLKFEGEGASQAECRRFDPDHPLHSPGRPSPGLGHFAECGERGVTPPKWCTGHQDERHAQVEDLVGPSGAAIPLPRIRISATRRWRTSSRTEWKARHRTRRCRRGRPGRPSRPHSSPGAVARICSACT